MRLSVFAVWSGNDVYFDENAFCDKIGMDPFDNHSFWIVDTKTIILMLAVVGSVYASEQYIAILDILD